MLMLFLLVLDFRQGSWTRLSIWRLKFAPDPNEQRTPEWFGEQRDLPGLVQPWAVRGIGA